MRTIFFCFFFLSSCFVAVSQSVVVDTIPTGIIRIQFDNKFESQMNSIQSGWKSKMIITIRDYIHSLKNDSYHNNTFRTFETIWNNASELKRDSIITQFRKWK